MGHLSSLCGLGLHKGVVAKMREHCFDPFLQRLVVEFTSLQGTSPSGIEHHGEAISVVELAIVVDRNWDQGAIQRNARTQI